MSTSLTDCGVAASARTTVAVRFRFTGVSLTALCLTSMISPAFPFVNSRG